jgi:hypothetical protein
MTELMHSTALHTTLNAPKPDPIWRTAVELANAEKHASHADLEAAVNRHYTRLIADRMWNECRKDEWQMAWNPWVARGRDHG